MWHLSILLCCGSLWESDVIGRVMKWEKLSSGEVLNFTVIILRDTGKLHISSPFTDPASYQDRNFDIFSDRDPEGNKQEIKKKVQFLWMPVDSVQPLFIFFLTGYTKGKNLILLENKIFKTFINSDFINWGDFRAMTGVLIKEIRIPNEEFENRADSQCW